MNAAKAKLKGLREQHSISGGLSSAFPVSLEQCLTYVITLIEAAEECNRSASRISELAWQAVDKLFHLAEEAT